MQKIFIKKHGLTFPIYDLLSNLPQEDFNSKFVEKEVVYKILMNIIKKITKNAALVINGFKTV